MIAPSFSSLACNNIKRLGQQVDFRFLLRQLIGIQIPYCLSYQFPDDSDRPLPGRSAGNRTSLVSTTHLHIELPFEVAEELLKVNRGIRLQVVQFSISHLQVPYRC